MKISFRQLRISTGLALLSAQVIVSGCAHNTATALALARARENMGFDRVAVNKAMADDPRNATLIAMETGFSLLRQIAEKGEDPRQADKDAAWRDAAELLERAHASFSDLTTPENMHSAFAADSDKPYRGRPHERVLTATSLALMDMLRGRCDLAIPTLRSAEFLDARWQPFPFGTDSPLVYALALRCNKQIHADASDIDRSRQGLLLSLRLKNGIDPALDLLHRVQSMMPRGHAISVRLAALLMERSLAAVLISDTRAQDPQAIFAAAAEQARAQLEHLDELLENPALSEIMERVARFAPQYGDPQWIKAQGLALIGPELQAISAASKALFSSQEQQADPVVTAMQKALDDSQKLARAIENAVSRDRLILHFSGHGPSIELEGEYDEVAVIKSSPDGSSKAELRTLHVGRLPTISCGLQADGANGFSAVLCAPKDKQESAQGSTLAADQTALKLQGSSLRALELWSSSYQASSAVGRRFEKVLRGRAQFKAGAENVSAVASWTSWYLFGLAGDAFSSCGSGDSSELCYGVALAILSVAVLSAGVAGTAWIVGSLINPKADGRYVHELFESGQILVPAEDLP